MKSSKRSADVRKQARANLLRIRQERLRRRAPIQSESVAIEPPVEQLESAFEEAITEDVFATPEASGEQQPEHNGNIDEVTPEAEKDISAVDPADAIESDDLTDDVYEPEADMGPESFDTFDETSLAVEDAEPEEASVIVEEVMESETLSPDSEPSEDGPEPHEPPSDVPSSDTDLMNLPGAGPGLVWMLWNASIHSLDELAQADPAELSLALGPVGRILDIEQLILLASESANATAELGN